MSFFYFFIFWTQWKKRKNWVRINILFSFFRFSIFWEKRENRKMIQESEIISFFSFSNNSKKIKNSKISLLAVYSIFCIFEADFKIRKMKKWSIFLTIFFFSIFVCALKYVNMIRISDISFFRFCWKNEKLDWPKCARTHLARVRGAVIANYQKHKLKLIIYPVL